jgi:hypothetical protein
MRKTRTTNRKLLKTTASFVLTSLKASTYSKYASAFRSLRPRWTAVLNSFPGPLNVSETIQGCIK